MFRKLLLLAKVEKGLQIYPKGFRLLDVGCNTGVVLELARALGFDAEGFEVSQNAAAISKKKGFRVASDQLDADFAPMTFDVVYASHVIEHLQNPPAFLASVRRILKDKGFLMLACPNRSAIGAWVRRDQHPCF